MSFHLFRLLNLWLNYIFYLYFCNKIGVLLFLFYLNLLSIWSNLMQSSHFS